MNIENLTMQEARKISPTFVADRLSQEQREALIGKPLSETDWADTTKETDIKYDGRNKFYSLIKNAGRAHLYLS